MMLLEMGLTAKKAALQFMRGQYLSMMGGVLQPIHRPPELLCDG